MEVTPIRQVEVEVEVEVVELPLARHGVMGVSVSSSVTLPLRKRLFRCM